MFSYNLPDENNNPVPHKTENNSIIIIGANGSGKSKLGAWMEENDMNNIHRISAQRSLMFGDYISLKSYEQAENLLFYGNEGKDLKKGPRWNWGKTTTTLLNDYENVLSSLIALNTLQINDFVKKCRESESLNQEHPKVPITVINILENIWNEVFPQRKINFDDSKVMTSFDIVENEVSKKIQYQGNEMSDGERVALYLIAQCLCIPQNKTVIIDEPEIHLHRSIMNKLWIEIEKSRPDCLFIYITHDTQFAASHIQSEKIWLKEYNGFTWDYEKVEESVLPEQLLLDILGNRKNVLFVEGTAGSYDTKLYREIYKKYYIVPCGSCLAVINYTKAFNATKQLHNLKCYGIIDRDYRSDYEIEKYKNDNIYCLNVAEVENLFIVPEMLDYVNKQMAYHNDSIITKVKEHIITERYNNEKNKQICNAIVAETKFKLTSLDLSNMGEQEIEEKLKKIYSEISYDKIKESIQNKYDFVTSTENYNDCLLIYNQKGLVKSIGHFYKLDNKEYCEFVLRKIKNESDEEILKILMPYLPPEIPIEN